MVRCRSSMTVNGNPDLASNAYEAFVFHRNGKYPQLTKRWRLSQSAGAMKTDSTAGSGKSIDKEGRPDVFEYTYAATTRKLVRMGRSIENSTASYRALPELLTSRSKPLSFCNADKRI